jgi:hypothetical protein
MPKLPKQRLVMKLPKRRAGRWKKTRVFAPKGAPDVVNEFVLKPSASSLCKKPCMRKVADKAEKSLRDCHVELVLNEGTFLRVCTKGGEPGPLIPVANHREATAVSIKYCACITKGGDRESCTVEVTPANVRLGSARRRR